MKRSFAVSVYDTYEMESTGGGRLQRTVEKAGRPMAAADYLRIWLERHGIERVEVDVQTYSLASAVEVDPDGLTVVVRHV